MNKKIRYVHGVNPITGIQCTNRIVTSEEDVTLWQVDKVFDSEEEFDRIDTDEMGMICMPHSDFKKTMNAYCVMRGEHICLGITPMEAET